MRKFITSIPAQNILTGFTTAITTAIAPFAPFKINLTNDEKKGARTMAEGREGYARLISRIANQFPNSLSRADVPTELSNLLTYYHDLESNRLACKGCHSPDINRMKQLPLSSGWHSSITLPFELTN